MKVWVDDERPMPPEFDVHVKCSYDAIELLETGKVTVMSLDHDLGLGPVGSGYDIACKIEEMAYRGQIAPIDLRVHSQNPVGAKNILTCINNANRYWAK